MEFEIGHLNLLAAGLVGVLTIQQLLSRQVIPSIMVMNVFLVALNLWVAYL